MTPSAETQNEAYFDLSADQPQVERVLDETPVANVSTAAVEAVPRESDAWQVISILPRLDSDNHADLMTEVHNVLASGARHVALDLSQNRFFSLNAIQLCVSLARDLAADDGGFALIGCIERTKRHFEIYGSLKQIKLVRSINELVEGRTQAVVMRSRSGSSQEAG